ncbi:hypothetical protein [Limnobacter sp.]|uniref:hypothetical protein n=1 Tax=Limnobacter sp. TaxID=2003368 RepID=UPI0031200EB4
MNQNDQMRELCRRLYVELFHCDKQMTSTLNEDGEPLWNSGKTVRDVLADAKQALNHTPDTGKMADHIGDANKMVELFDQVVSPAILNCIGKIAEEITARRIWDEVRRAMLKNNGVQHD